MKTLMILMLGLVAPTMSMAYQCQDFMKDSRKVESLDFIAKNFFNYSGYQEFCEKDQHMDLELYMIPNYFKYQEEDDDHYKLMVHYAYRSCTVIYNITQKHISEKSCYSTW